MTAMTLDGAGRPSSGRTCASGAAHYRALTDLLDGFRLARAPGGPRLLRSPLPAATGSCARRSGSFVDDLLRGRWAGTGSPAPVWSGLAPLHRGGGPAEVMTLLLAGTRRGHGPGLGAGGDRHAPGVRTALEEGGCRSGNASADALPRTRALLARDPAAVAVVLDVQPPRPSPGARRTPRPGRTMCLVRPLRCTATALVGQPEQFRPDRWGARAGARRPLRPEAARAAARGVPAVRGGPADVHREQFAWPSARSCWPSWAGPGGSRLRDTAARPVVDDAATGRWCWRRPPGADQRPSTAPTDRPD